MIIIYFSACGGIFVVVFLLMIISGATLEFCSTVSNFIADNLIAIIAVLGSVSLIVSAISGFITGKPKNFIANFSAIVPLLIGLVLGLYNATTLHPDSAFLSIFAVIVYAVIFFVEVVITVVVAISSMENDKIWPIILLGIFSLVFNLFFW